MWGRAGLTHMHCWHFFVCVGPRALEWLTPDLYAISRQPWKWTNKQFFHLLNLLLITVLLCSPLVQNYHTEYSDWHWWGTSYKETRRMPQTYTEARKTSPIHQATKQTIQDDKHAFGMQENWVLCMFWCKQRNKNKIQESRMQHGVVCYPMLYHMKQHFLGPADIKLEKQSTYISKQCHCYCWSDILQ